MFSFSFLFSILPSAQFLFVISYSFTSRFSFTFSCLSNFFFFLFSLSLLTSPFLLSSLFPPVSFFFFFSFSSDFFFSSTLMFFCTFPVYSGLNATSAGKRNEAQNIRLLGATSLTGRISTSLSSGSTLAPSRREISSQILIFSAALSSLLVEKQ